MQRDYAKILRDRAGNQVVVTVTSIQDSPWFSDEFVAGISVRTAFVGDYDPLMIFPYRSFERAFGVFETTSDKDWISTAEQLLDRAEEQYRASVS